MAVADNFADEPVVMIAVNSGNSRAKVESYARKNHIEMPIIVDSSRSLEKQLGVKRVSLRNIWAAAILKPDGRVARSSAGDLEAAFNQALQGAEWNVDPSGMPDDLRPAWHSIELGNFAVAAPAVSEGLESEQPDVKAAAEKLNAYVQGLIQQQFESAEKADAADNKLEAYRSYSSVQNNFEGFELPEDLAQTVQDLSTDTTVKKELAAKQRLEAAKKDIRSSSRSSRYRARIVLRTLVKTDPDTEAGKQARAMLRR